MRTKVAKQTTYIGLRIKSGHRQMHGDSISYKVRVIGHTSADFLTSLYHRVCSHSYDCCGCFFGGVTLIKQVRKNTWALTVTYHRNV